MLKFCSVALFALAVAGSASAQAALTATLATPAAKPTRLVMGGTAWDCAESTCKALVRDSESATWIGCRALVRSVGAVTAYGSLDAEKLAKCNASARK